MRRLTLRQALFTVAAVLVVTAFLALAVRSAQHAGNGPNLSVHAGGANGASYLHAWLNRLGFVASPLEYRPFGLESGTAALFVLAPINDYTEAEADRVVRWVEDGGRLVLVFTRPTTLAKRLGLEIRTRDRLLTSASPPQPVFPEPGLREATVDTRWWLRVPDESWVAALGPTNEPVAVLTHRGKGRILAVADDYAVSNAGIGMSDNWMLAWLLLSGLPSNAQVLFDEYHHGLTEQRSFGESLVREGWGRAILYGIVLGFLYVAARGRRFGRAVPAPDLTRPRSRGEYVRTMAALLRQGRHAKWLQGTYAQQVKRSTGVGIAGRGGRPSSPLTGGRAALVEVSEKLALIEQARLSDRALLQVMRDIASLAQRNS